MFRLFIVASFFAMHGCQANNKSEDISQHSFSETIKFPTDLVFPENRMMDPSCKWKQSIVPIFDGDEFISFLHQECEFKRIKVNVDQGSVKFTLLQEGGIGEPFEYGFPPLIIETDETNSPEEYLDKLYTTAEERLHCKKREVSPDIWEIRNIGYATIPEPPPEDEDDSKLTQEERRLKIQKRMKKRAELTHEERKLENQKRMRKIAQHHNKQYKKYEEQSRINRICDNIPHTNYFFFEGEHILTMPKTHMPFLDVASIEYHKK